jgi:hypothetical protein
MEYNNAGDSGIKLLAEGLMENTTLRLLNIR